MWKNMFSSGKCKRGLQVCIGKWKRPYEQVAWGEENLSITRWTPWFQVQRVNMDHSLNVKSKSRSPIGKMRIIKILRCGIRLSL
jgi:hypothetical protein